MKKTGSRLRPAPYPHTEEERSAGALYVYYTTGRRLMKHENRNSGEASNRHRPGM